MGTGRRILILAIVVLFVGVALVTSVEAKKVEARRDGLYVDGKKMSIRGMFGLRAVDDPVVMGTKPNGSVWKATDFEEYEFNVVLAENAEWLPMLRKVKDTNTMVLLMQLNQELAPPGSIKWANGSRWIYYKIKKDVGQAIKEGLDDHILGYWVDEPFIVGVTPEAMKEAYDYAAQAEIELFGEKKHPFAITYWSSYSYSKEKGNYLPACDFLIPDLYPFDTEYVLDGREYPEKCLIEYERQIDDIYTISGDKPVIPLIQAAHWWWKKTQFYPPAPEYINAMIDITRRKCYDNFFIIGWHETYPINASELLYDQGYDYYIKVLNHVKSSFAPLIPTPTLIPTATPTSTFSTLTPTQISKGIPGFELLKMITSLIAVWIFVRVQKIK